MKSIIFIILLPVLMACDKVLDVDIEYEGSKLSISCMINPYDSVSVSISETNDPSNKLTEFEYISNAQISLFEDGIEIKDFKYDTSSHYFISSLIPRVGPEYQLIIDVPAYKQVISNVIRIPEAKQIDLSNTPIIVTQENDTIDTGDGIVIKVNFGRTTTVKIKFDDPVEEDNFYLLRSNVFLESGGGSGVSLGGLYSEGCNFSNNLLAGYVFDDYCFNGLEANIEMNVLFSGNNPRFNARIFSLDRSAYDYLKNLGEYKNSLFFQSELNLDPIRVPSSFENAFGVFGAYHYTDTTIMIE